MKFTVPSYSQFLDIEDKEWKDKSCGVVSLKMLMDYWSGDPDATSEDFEDLITEGLGFGGYLPGAGWRHKELTDVARGHGLAGENLDWTDEHTDVAFNKTIPYLTKHPVMVSVHKDLKEGMSGHLVVLTGYEDGKIFYNDPDSKKKKECRTKRSSPGIPGWMEKKDCRNTQGRMQLQ